MSNTDERTTAILLQVSVLTQYFIPFGNIIFPVLIWSMKRKESKFIDDNGKQAINFQLSLLFYCLAIVIIAVPIILYSAINNRTITAANCDWIINEIDNGKLTSIIITLIVSIVTLSILKVLEFCLILYAAVKTVTEKITTTL